MKSKLERRVNLLIAYALLSSLAIVILISNLFMEQNKKGSYDELEVKRINLIAEDGTLRMVLSNENRQHPGVVNGKQLPDRERDAGILFFNTEGDECGGLIYHGNNQDGQTHSGMSFTMDQYHNDQVIQILNSEYYKGEESEIHRGISISDIPIGLNLDETMDKYEELEKIADEKQRNKLIQELFQAEGSKRRLFMGKTSNEKTGLFLADAEGNYKLKLYVDSEGNPKFESINEDGETVDLLAK